MLAIRRAFMLYSDMIAHGRRPAMWLVGYRALLEFYRARYATGEPVLILPTSGTEILLGIPIELDLKGPPERLELISTMPQEEGGPPWETMPRSTAP